MEYSDKFDDHRGKPPIEMEKFVIENLIELAISKKLNLSNMDLPLKDFDSDGLTPSVTSDDESNHPKAESGCVFTKDMIYEIVNVFINQSFAIASAILKKKLQSKEYIESTYTS